MRRRTVDFIAAAGGIALAAVLVLGAFVLGNNADFADDYVRQQLSGEKIEFTALEDLSEEDRAYSEARTGCIIEYAGKTLVSGKHAECYANEYLGAHLSYLATRLGMPQVAYVDGLTYRELGGVQRDLGEQIAAAEEGNDPSLAALEQELADVSTVRTKMFEGTMLRNALLTSYGFSVLGVKAGQAATAFLIAAVAMGVLGLVALAHGLVTPRSRAFAPVEPSPGSAASVQPRIPEREMLKV
jgi:hypothetical protein